MSKQSEASETVTMFGVGGLIVAVIAGVVAVMAWPTPAGLEAEESGNAVVAYLALLVFSFAQIAVFIAVVAWGVRLGIHWSGLGDSAEDAAAASAAIGRTVRGDGTASGAGVVGTPPVSRRPGNLSGIEPLGPVADREWMNEDGQ